MTVSLLRDVKAVTIGMTLTWHAGCICEKVIENAHSMLLYSICSVPDTFYGHGAETGKNTSTRNTYVRTYYYYYLLFILLFKYSPYKIFLVCY